MSLPDPVTLLDELEPVLGARQGEPVALDGGITNRNFRVVLGGADYVLRICGKDTAVLGIDRAAECQATMAAAQLGIGPEVVLYRPDLEVLVTRWIEGRVASGDDVRGAIEPVAAALRAVHGGPSLPARFDTFALVFDYRDEIRERGGRDPPGFHEAAAAAARIKSALVPTHPDHEPVPCHNDLLPANFLLDGETLRIVDWEYAGMGDRFFDLGNLAVNNGFDGDDEARLIAAYFGAPSARRLAALRLMRVMSDFREAMWGAVQEVVSELEFDYRAYRDEHFERLLAATRAPEFERSVTDAAAA
jgi:thiamine kinase-like enzyme